MRPSGRALVAAITSAVCRPPRSEFTRTLQTHSDDLLKISEDFRPLASRYAIVSFYEEHAYGGLGTVIVDRSSAVMGLAHEEAMMLAGTHSSMCKYGSLGDRGFEAVWKGIRRASKGPVS
ncbi:hypothetical protein QBC46DRAFT_391280 [Diplogelasinospora grovesii]|uniref:Uncharacterized protein n=1 Tax=Diplogelasinospora grovesii TaxID=303347 RepID=A0AAN6N2E6_9PEZI|nr:hypothetical protein QBC46DRAFT_391280 [Diplogelasinospora grovesii]